MLTRNNDVKMSNNFKCKHKIHWTDCFTCNPTEEQIGVGMIPASEKAKLEEFAREIADKAFTPEPFRRRDFQIDFIFGAEKSWDLAVKHTLEEEWKEIRSWKPTLHWCADWEFLLIDKNDGEFEHCTCFKTPPQSDEGAEG